MSLNDLIRHATSRAGVVRVSNVLNSLLWASATATPICFVASYVFGGDPLLHYALAVLGCLPVLLMLGAYVYFMFREPDRLQSEAFVLRQQEISTFERKAGPPIVVPIDDPVEPPRLSEPSSTREPRP